MFREIGILTNARFDKYHLTKFAGMAHNGLSRTICPVHTTADGDSLYAMSLGDLRADQDAVRTLASDVVSMAVLRAQFAARSAYGFPSAQELAPQAL